MIEVTGQQAAPRVGDTECAVHEDLELDIGTGVADVGHLVQRQLAREDDPRDPLQRPEAHRRCIGGVRLNRKVDRLIRPALAHQHDQTGVGHDERIRTHRQDRLQIRDEALELRAVGEDVGGEIEALAVRMRLGDGARERRPVEGVVAHAQTVSGQAGIDGVRPVGEGIPHRLRRACRREQLGWQAAQRSSTWKLSRSSAPSLRSRRTSTGIVSPGPLSSRAMRTSA